MEFWFRDGKEDGGMRRWECRELRKLDFELNGWVGGVKLGKGGCKRVGIRYWIWWWKCLIENGYMVEGFIWVFGIRVEGEVIEKVLKEVILFSGRGG